MATFAGMVHNYLTPTPISSAEVEADRITIRQGSWVYEAKSRDGFYYEGNYGERKVDSDRVFLCWLYPGPDGSKIVYSYWYHRNEKGTQGESVFRLVPNTRPLGARDELPEEWDLARRTLETQANLTSGTALELLLVHDRWTGFRDNESAMNQAGLYVIFYGNGKIARIGQASRSLAKRLPDYEPHAAGWFGYRWVGIIPVTSDKTNIITPLEDNLLAILKPPENTRGVDRDSASP